MKQTRVRFSALLPRGRTFRRGAHEGLPITADVEVLRDRLGIPHVFAQNEHDLFVAQGFIHAEDRLWQMESIRRLTAGRLAEVAGESAVNLDHFSILAGFGALRDRAVRAASAATRRVLAAYVEGINAFQAAAGDRLPLEFRSLGVPVREWSVEDLCGVLPINSWFLQTNFQEELVALLARSKLSAERFNELFPSYPGARLPHERFFERYASLKLAPLLPAALGFYPELSALTGARAGASGTDAARPSAPLAAVRYDAAPPAGAAGAAGGGSNNWIVAKGEGGLPLVANDPHLGMMVPQVWHLCHLSCPTLNIAGSSMPGVPGIVIGRNERIAWGLTNVMTDLVDLYAFRVDPTSPTRYVVGSEMREMEIERVGIPVAGQARREITVHRTVHGPLITEASPGAEAVAALKWYGTLPASEIEETTIDGFFALFRARSVAEAFEAGRLIKSVGQNLVVGDVEGAIGWHATGLIPVRSGYSGRAPADGSSGSERWNGFAAYDEMPSALNPSAGWIATANHKSVPHDAEHPPTYTWAAPYRKERVDRSLSALVAAPGAPTVEHFRALQLDRHSVEADRLLPRVLERTWTDPRAREAADILGSWDRSMGADSRGALVFSVFHTELARALLSDLLGEALAVHLTFAPLTFTATNAFLEGAPARALLEATRFGAQGGEALIEAALERTVDRIVAALGPNRSGWRWGALHTFYYEHAGAAGAKGLGGAITRWLLNRGPYPAGGGSTTVNVSAFNPGWSGSARREFQAATVPSIRFIASLADPDRTFIMAPMGQSGQPGDRHYDDMIRPWIRGTQVPFPLTRAGAERVARERAIFRPNELQPKGA